MKDTNGVEIGIGNFVKRIGLVQYADGWKRKISKKTWKVSKIENGEIFYVDENGNDTHLPVPAHEGAFLVVSETVFEQIPTIKPSGVPQKYRVHGDQPAYKWKDGDIVQIFGTVSEDTLKSGKLECVPDTVEHKHILIVADPLRVFGNQN